MLEFKRLSTLDNSSSVKELMIPEFQKHVLCYNGHTDNFKMCLWLLRYCFKCAHTKPLNPIQFRSLTIIVDRFLQFKFPLVLLMETTNSMYNHVIGVWKNMIIDFEEKSVYPLTVNNFDYLCGSGSTFVQVVQGYGIFPSKEIRKHPRLLIGLRQIIIVT